MAAAGGHQASRIIAGLGVLGFAAAFCTVYLDSPSKWWYEDDPLQFSAAAAISNPLDIFLDPQVLHRWGTGASLVPMHVLSYWLDTHLFGISPSAARLHSLASTLLTCWLFYVVLASLGAARVVAAFGACLWLCLPATIAVHYFLGTRHYIEGLAWSLAAACLLVRVCRSPSAERAVAQTLLILFCAAAAILSKEIYVTTLPAFLFLYALWHRRYVLSAAAVGLLPGYFVYRLALLGGAAYPHPAFDTESYLRYLRVLPYTFSVSRWGWVYYGGLVVGAVWAIRRDRQAWRACLLLLILFAAGLVATYPTAPAVLLTYETPGTWYRAVFILHTLALIGGTILLGSYADGRVRIAALLIIVVILSPGVGRTRRYWESRFAQSEAEGRFYLAHPDRLVYSEEDATWFLPGLERLYGIARSHYISKNELSGAHVKSMTLQFPTIWRQRKGSWARDDDLFARIRQRALAAP